MGVVYLFGTCYGNRAHLARRLGTLIAEGPDEIHKNAPTRNCYSTYRLVNNAGNDTSTWAVRISIL